MPHFSRCRAAVRCTERARVARDMLGGRITFSVSRSQTRMRLRAESRSLAEASVGSLCYGIVLRLRVVTDDARRKPKCARARSRIEPARHGLGRHRRPLLLDAAACRHRGQGLAMSGQLAIPETTDPTTASIQGRFGLPSGFRGCSGARCGGSARPQRTFRRPSSAGSPAPRMRPSCSPTRHTHASN
jgi:hypothetical protein